MTCCPHYSGVAFYIACFQSEHVFTRLSTGSITSPKSVLLKKRYTERNKSIDNLSLAPVLVPVIAFYLTSLCSKNFIS